MSRATKEIAAAWQAYQKTEKYGLEFGRVCCEWRDKFKSKGGYGSKGKGLTGCLQVLNIPRGTSDYWMARYEVSIGKKPEYPEVRDKTWHQRMMELPHTKSDSDAVETCICTVCGNEHQRKD